MRALMLGVTLWVAVAMVPGVVHADGEAGLVIQHGDGTTETFCIPFTGDSITGDKLLARAGVPVEQFSGLVCAIGTNQQEGCFNAGSFESCTCKCRGGSCQYWAFFTQRYGAGWVYSALGFTAQRARDGDLQAWKWGVGGASSAPAPAPVTFEQVCGHAPRGGAAASPSAVTVTVTQPATTQAPVATPAASGATAAATSTAASPPATLTVVVTMAVTPDGSTTPAPRPVPVEPLVRQDDGTPVAAVIAFVMLMALLLAALVTAMVWRGRRAS